MRILATIQRGHNVPAGEGVYFTAAPPRLRGLGRSGLDHYIPSTRRHLVFELPFVGCDPGSMALSTNKSRTKAVLGSGGTPVPRGELLHTGDMPTLTMPFIVKPCSEDNSMGVTLVRSAEDADAALAEAFKFDSEVRAHAV